MMRSRFHHAWYVALVFASAAPASMGQLVETSVDPEDAVLIRTDPGADASVSSPTWPDMLSLSIGAWQPFSPATDPYAGSFVQPSGATMFRLDLEFKGLVNPPGPLGLGGQAYEPSRHGPSPVYGFFELNVDRDRDTGGELGPAAASRRLANIARFGTVGESSSADRVAKWSSDIDGVLATGPQYERSGAEFSLVFCGCSPLTIISRAGGNADDVFDAGETWVVQGRFFQRADGFRLASGMFGGTAPGLYDPQVRLRFKHDVVQDRTTVSLVFALTQAGAAALAGQTVQSVNLSASDHVSIQEGMQDVITRAGSLPWGSDTWVLASRWSGEDITDYLDPREWRVAAIVGTAYDTPQPDALFAWTDVGFECSSNDLDGDGLADAADLAIWDSELAASDGGPRDADGVANGVVSLGGVGSVFSLYDLNVDGFINALDREIYAPTCRADVNQSGAVTTQDLFDFITLWYARDPAADFNANGSVTSQDLFDYISAWYAGC